MGLQRFIGRNGKILGFAAIVVAVSAVVASAFVTAYVRVLHREFRERSLAYVQAFAAASLPWVRDDLTMLRSAAQLLLAGSARYVQIADGERLLIDERAASAGDLDLPLRETVASSSVALSRDPSGGSHLDILVPFPSFETSGDVGGSTGESGDLRGYVRVGIDRAAVLAQSSGVAAIASGAAIGLDAVLIALLAFVVRVPRREEAGGRLGRERRVIRAGALEIDPVRKSVRLGGMPVRLTPKQFTLLDLLAGEPGRVFSESEILEAAWPDSPYADAKDIKQYVYLLRRRLSEVDPDARSLIETVPGFGYRLAVEEVDPELT